MANLSLEEVGLGKSTQTLFYSLSLLPLVGLVIGVSYAVRRNAATRQFGRRLMIFSVGLHIFYAVCLCPAALIIALSR